MKTALVLAIVLFGISSATAAEDAWTRLRNASANELCWDTARGVAREKYPSADTASMTPVSLTRSAAPNPVKESRKAFPGIRTC